MEYGDTFMDRLFFMGIGFILGLILGWVSNAMKYAREARNDAHSAKERVEQLMEDKDESGKADINKIALLAVVLLVAVSAVITGITSSKVSSTQESIGDSQRCTELVLANVITSLNERTSYTGDINEADRSQNEAFLLIIDRLILANNPPSQADQARLIKSYRKKLETYLDLIDKASKKRTNNPYPEVSDYRECLNDSKNED